MISVLTQKNEVIGFPDTTDVNTIHKVISNDQSGEITQAQPNWYRDKVQPVLEATGMDMFQPKFLGAKVDPDATRAFVTSYAKDASFGAFENKDPEIMALTAEAQKQHPIAAFTGALAGQTQALLMTAGLGEAFGLGKAAGAATEALGKTAGNVVSGAGIGALYGAITGSFDQVNSAIKDNTAPSLVKVGQSALKDAGIFGLYGVAGSIASYPVATAAIAGTAYTISRAEGQDEQDALLNAATMAIFHVVHSSIQTPESLQQHQDALDQVKSDYIKSMNPGIHDAIVDRTAQEHTMEINDLVKQDNIVKDEKGIPIELGKISNAPSIESINGQVEDILNVKPKEASSAISYVTPKGEKVFTKLSSDELSKLTDEVKNIPTPPKGENQIHLDAITPNLLKYGKEVSREDFVKGHSQVENLFNPEKISKASKDINKNLVNKGFEELPETEQAKYTPITKKDQINKVSKLIATDYEKAKNMALGKEPIDGDINSQVIFNAVKNKALNELDVSTLRDLASSPIATERSEAAQKLSASGFDNGIHQEDPISAMQEVSRARTNKTDTKGKSKVIKDIQKEIKKARPKVEDWHGFIDSLEC